eukprot:TRINITY_DN40033_c0_g1_i1.p1 TRINITY_DN40033_c0_g1~~TRINITY_DN40033_c0_g1_i1.p1  ORF type:complete len:1132 (+),score=166.07 TRINITY_DN40033_c0_g1_i1:42-3398(+)
MASTEREEERQMMADSYSSFDHTPLAETFADHTFLGESFEGGDPAQRTCIQIRSGLATVVPEKVALASNAVCTTRFTLLTWLPKSLWCQFHRIANLYFVLVALLSTLPIFWQGSKSASKVSVVCCILLAQAVKDLYEDRKRLKDDRVENNRPCVRYRQDSGDVSSVEWRELRAGEFVLLREGDLIPADIVVLATSETSNICYVSTKSLDGETNLKMRQAVQCFRRKLGETRSETEALSRINSVDLDVALNPAMASLAEMDGFIKSDERIEGISMNNFLLRGCELENTAWIIGLICYTGDLTKVRLNAAETASKTTDLERYLNYCVVSILVFILLVSTYFSLASIGLHHAARANGLPTPPAYEVFIRYLIVLYVVLPMTLYIAFEVMHLIIGWQINVDTKMYDSKTDAFATARNTSILEELGQVDFLFSDKTGTLTANEMRFAFCCIGSKVVGPFLGEDGAGWAKARRMLKEGGASQRQALDFFNLLAVCHTVQAQDGDHYQAESPDEVALVQGAKGVGIKFLGRRQQGSGSLCEVEGQHPVRVSHVLAFNSDRKRMSVVCPTDDGGAHVLTKGADTVMEGLIAQPLPREALQALTNFSHQGLRTLVVAQRRMSANEYATWTRMWSKASAAMKDRDAALAQAMACAESNLLYVGVTALEDRLQDRVPETIANIRMAGIRVWVLTGDKVETAVEIARSCKLFDTSMRLHHIENAQTPQAAIEAMRNPPSNSSLSLADPSNRGLVLDGTSVAQILEDPDARKMLYDLGVNSSSCVCCRLSPMQKRKLVELVCEQNPKTITLAIGDGANDVPMIQGAHVGVGIRGKEGSASVQACDVAISQFSFLANLLFCHGRNAYRRLATYLVFFIYKSVVLGWSYMIYAHTILFSGLVAFPEWLDMIYNPLTSCAVVFILCFDVQVKDDIAVTSPELYSPGPLRAHLNPWLFARWMVLACFHGVLAWSIPAFLLASAEDLRRQSATFWMASFTAFSVIFIIVHLKLLLVAQYPMHLYTKLVYVLELLAYLAAAIVLGTSMGKKLAPEMEGIPLQVVKSPPHLACLILLPLAALLPDAVIEVYERFFRSQVEVESSESESEITASDGTERSSMELAATSVASPGASALRA